MLRWMSKKGEEMATQRYSAEFKEEAIKQVTERNYPVTEVAERLGVTTVTLYSWLKAANGPGSGRTNKEVVERKDREIAALKGQVKRLEEERDILKKAAAYFAKESR